MIPVAVEVASRPKVKSSEPLVLLSDKDVAWKRFKWAVEALAKTEFGEEGLKAFYNATDAYRELRDSYIQRRRRQKTEGKDESLEYWAKQREDFRATFFGIDEGSWVGQGKSKKWKAKRRFKGCSAEIVRYMRTYQSLWNMWWPHTARGLKSKKRSNAKQAKRESVKAAKAAANKTEAAKAARKRSKVKSRQAARVARAQAEQALYDSWAAEEAIEEALRDV